MPGGDGQLNPTLAVPLRPQPVWQPRTQELNWLATVSAQRPAHEGVGEGAAVGHQFITGDAAAGLSRGCL